MLIPKNTYPAQTDDTDPTGYPHGKARNANSPNDGNGFPLESQWVNDLFGFFQALVGAAGITPSGNPEKADASDCLDALNAIYRRQDELGAVSFDVSGTNLALAAKFGLAARISHPDVLLSDDEVTLPIGRWKLDLYLTLRHTSDGDPHSLIVNIQRGEDQIGALKAIRYSATTGETIGGSTVCLFDISDPASQKVSLRNGSTAGLGVSVPHNTLILTRVGEIPEGS